MMRAIDVPDIVFSCAGHDRGEVYIVIETTRDKVLLVNGKTRKLANPKAKSLKHLRLGRAGKLELGEAISRGEASDKLIRKELAIFRGEVGQQMRREQLVERRCN